MLRYFFLKTTEQYPATKNDFSSIVQSDKRSGEILTNTYIQNVRRLRGKLEEVGVPSSIIDVKRHFIVNQLITIIKKSLLKLFTVMMIHSF